MRHIVITTIMFFFSHGACATDYTKALKTIFTNTNVSIQELTEPCHQKHCQDNHPLFVVYSDDFYNLMTLIKQIDILQKDYKRKPLIPKKVTSKVTDCFKLVKISIDSEIRLDQRTQNLKLLCNQRTIISSILSYVSWSFFGWTDPQYNIGLNTLCVSLGLASSLCTLEYLVNHLYPFYQENKEPPHYYTLMISPAFVSLSHLAKPELEEESWDEPDYKASKNLDVVEELARVLRSMRPK